MLDYLRNSAGAKSHDRDRRGKAFEYYPGGSFVCGGGHEHKVQIGKSGTNEESGAALHFEVWKGKSKQNPLAWLK